MVESYRISCQPLILTGSDMKVQSCRIVSLRIRSVHPAVALLSLDSIAKRTGYIRWKTLWTRTIRTWRNVCSRPVTRPLLSANGICMPSLPDSIIIMSCRDKDVISTRCLSKKENGGMIRRRIHGQEKSTRDTLRM